MSVIVIVRTRDEAHRIGQFCEAYKDADKILVADGGSEDNTKEIAARYPNVEIRDYTGRVQLQGGYWRNNDSDHTNFLIAWAKEYDPAWIISDDCDCRPNALLKQDYRSLLHSTEYDFVMVTRLFIWHNGQHFTYLAKPDRVNWEPSLWAWRGNLDFWTVDVPPAFIFRIGEQAITDLRTQAKTLDLLPPYCLLHYSWDNLERVEKKVKTYRESGFIPSQLHPLQYGSPLEDPPEWAHE